MVADYAVYIETTLLCIFSFVCMTLFALFRVRSVVRPCRSGAVVCVFVVACLETGYQAAIRACIVGGIMFISKRSCGVHFILMTRICVRTKE